MAPLNKSAIIGLKRVPFLEVRCEVRLPCKHESRIESDLSDFYLGWIGFCLVGIVGLLIKTFKFKGVFYKKAFLNIADQAVGEERSINRPPRRLAHSKLVGTSRCSLIIWLRHGLWR